MLAAAFGSWISQLTERDFDAPFTELLRAHGFYDLHFTHGAYEFGKDFIAKRDEPLPTQYAFQAKAGDVGGAEWNRMRGQFEELADGGPAHPSFAVQLPRRSVVVLTGRLTGKATVAPSDFRTRLRETGRGDFDVWDVDTLSELLAGSSRFPAGPSDNLLPILGLVETGKANDRELERELARLLVLNNELKVIRFSGQVG